MVVVADTSPLNYLILIDEIGLLAELYRRILIPDLVFEELRHPDAPSLVRNWTAALPSWVEIVSSAARIDPALDGLDAGEAAAITLALANAGALLLMDEAVGRAEAMRRHIETIGTLGILRDAAALDLVDLSVAFAKLGRTSFRAPASLMADLLARDTRRRSGGG